MGSEVVATSTGVPFEPRSLCVGLAPAIRHHVVDVSTSSGGQALHAVSPAPPQCLGSSSVRRGSGVLG